MHNIQVGDVYESLFNDISKGLIIRINKIGKAKNDYSGIVVSAPLTSNYKAGDVLDTLSIHIFATAWRLVSHSNVNNIYDELEDLLNT